MGMSGFRAGSSGRLGVARGRTRRPSPACRPCAGSGPRSPPNLPTVVARVGRDERLIPVGRGPLLVVPLEGLAVVLPLVPKRPEGVEPVAAGDQPVPVIVADLVPEMAQERAVIFLHRMPPPLALGVVGLGHVDGDHPVFMPGEHRGRAGWGRGPPGIQSPGRPRGRRPSWRWADPAEHYISGGAWRPRVSPSPRGCPAGPGRG